MLTLDPETQWQLNNAFRRWHESPSSFSLLAVEHDKRKAVAAQFREVAELIEKSPGLCIGLSFGFILMNNELTNFDIYRGALGIETAVRAGHLIVEDFIETRYPKETNAPLYD